jgi:hypothetical protein
MRRIIILALLIVFPTGLAAATDRYLGAGVALKNDAGELFAILRSDPFVFLYTEHTGPVIGASYFAHADDNSWELGFGISYVSKLSTVNGTHANFVSTAGYCWPQWCARFMHLSHGTLLGIEKDRPNHGWNVLAVEYKL